MYATSSGNGSLGLRGELEQEAEVRPAFECGQTKASEQTRIFLSVTAIRFADLSVADIRMQPLYHPAGLSVHE